MIVNVFMGLPFTSNFLAPAALWNVFILFCASQGSGMYYSFAKRFMSVLSTQPAQIVYAIANVNRNKYTALPTHVHTRTACGAG